MHWQHCRSKTETKTENYAMKKLKRASHYLQKGSCLIQSKIIRAIKVKLYHESNKKNNQKVCTKAKSLTLHICFMKNSS